MITEERLTKAAACSNELLVRFYERDFDAEHPHEFSQRFEQNMEALRQSVERPLLRRYMRRVVSLLLVLVLGGALWLSVDGNARASLLGWIRNLYETYVNYSFERSEADPALAEGYRPTWLPEGYEEVSLTEESDGNVILYRNNLGHTISFVFSSNPLDTNWFIDKSQATITTAYINGSPAELFISNDPQVANSITWVTYDNIAILISAFLDKDALIQIAEGVSQK